MPILSSKRKILSVNILTLAGFQHSFYYIIGGGGGGGRLFIPFIPSSRAPEIDSYSLTLYRH